MTGYHHCSCRDCFELYVGEAGDMCDACLEAECGGAGCLAAEAYDLRHEQITDERSPQDIREGTE